MDDSILDFWEHCLQSTDRGIPYTPPSKEEMENITKNE